MRKKKELTEAEKRDLAMKYEVAEELGLLEKVERCGWRGLTSRESGRIGGIMGTRKTAERKRTEADRSGQSGQSGHLKGQAVDRGVDRGMDSRKTFPVYKDSCLHLKTDRAII